MTHRTLRRSLGNCTADTQFLTRDCKIPCHAYHGSRAAPRDLAPDAAVPGLSRPASGGPRAPPVPARPGQPSQAPAALHRRFDQHDLDAVALALAIERRYDITPAALAFGVRVLAEPAIRADVAELGRRIGRIQAPAARALDFEQERALRLLSMSPRRT